MSARIRTLEQQLGRQLFVRNKAGAALTASGEQFLRYAPVFVQLWHRALNQVALPPGQRVALTIGSEVSLWRPLLLNWIIWMRRSLRDIALSVHVDVPQDLINQVASGLVDVAIMYAPQHRPGLAIDLLMEEQLVLATTDPKGGLAHDMDYVHVDWGPDFQLRHGISFPERAPGFFVNLGPLALDYVLSAGGAGYFRRRAIQHHVAAGRLHLIQGMPQFSYPVYAVYSADADKAVLGPALAGLHSIADAPVE